MREDKTAVLCVCVQQGSLYSLAPCAITCRSRKLLLSRLRIWFYINSIKLSASDSPLAREWCCVCVCASGWVIINKLYTHTQDVFLFYFFIFFFAQCEKKNIVAFAVTYIYVRIVYAYNISIRPGRMRGSHLWIRRPTHTEFHLTLHNNVT